MRGRELGVDVARQESSPLSVSWSRWSMAVMLPCSASVGAAGLPLSVSWSRWSMAVMLPCSAIVGAAGSPLSVSWSRWSMAVMLPCSASVGGGGVAAERQLVAVVDGGDAAVLGNCRRCRVAAECQLVAVVDGGDAAVFGQLSGLPGRR